jgi:hypothetical protein
VKLVEFRIGLEEGCRGAVVRAGELPIGKGPGPGLAVVGLLVAELEAAARRLGWCWCWRELGADY